MLPENVLSATDRVEPLEAIPPPVRSPEPLTVLLEMVVSVIVSDPPF